MRIVCWNIHSSRGLDGVVSVPRVAETIAGFSPDVVGLNEVRRTPVLNQPKLLAAELGMPTAFQRNLVAPGIRFGNAVMTRGTILEYRHIALPWQREPRGLLLSRLDVAGERFWLGVTHLGLSAAIRAEQKRAILEALPSDEPLLLMGDFNEGPVVLGEIARRLTLAPPSPSFPAHAPERAIDFVLHSDHWRVERVEVPPTIASDHRPLVVDVERV